MNLQIEQFSCISSHAIESIFGFLDDTMNLLTLNSIKTQEITEKSNQRRHAVTRIQLGTCKEQNKK